MLLARLCMDSYIFSENTGNMGFTEIDEVKNAVCLSAPAELTLIRLKHTLMICLKRKF